MAGSVQWLSGHEGFCASQNVTYDHRVFDPDAHNWCPVPGGGADTLLFAGLAVFTACALYSRLSAVWVLCAGGLFQLLSFYTNLGHFSNALTVWLGMHPTFLFFQAFLPPLLLDSAVRIDFFLFRKMAAHVLLFAFVNVVISTVAMIPLMLHGLNLAVSGWRPIDAALFGAMLGSTDAVAVTAILKAGGAPELLSVLLEGESLFNDASSIVLFELFLELGSRPGNPSLTAEAFNITKNIAWLAGSGAVCGFLMGLFTWLLLKLVHKRHAPPHVEVAVSLAGAYTVYLFTEYYVDGSGVIAVVVYGLYGASSFLYGMSAKGIRTGAFFKFWDVTSFITNGMVFFFVGSSIMNFILSLSEELFKGGSSTALVETLKALPVVIFAMFLLRWGLMWLEAPLLSVVGNKNLTWQEVTFSAVGGLRGGLALILAQTVLAGHEGTQDEQLKVIHGQMVLWVSGFVLFTLCVNAPLLGPLMGWLKLNQPTPLQKQMHRRAFAALAQYTQRTITELQADDDEMLRGVDWAAVAATADLGKDAKSVLATADSADTADLKGQLAAIQAPGTDGAAAKHGSASGLKQPLLQQQTDEDDQDSEDLEQGLRTVKANGHVSSEAMFIHARLHAQDKLLAQHAAVTEDYPWIADGTSSSLADGPDSASLQPDAQPEPQSSGTLDESEGPEQPDPQQANSQEAAEETTPTLKLLSPLVVIKLPGGKQHAAARRATAPTDSTTEDNKPSFWRRNSIRVQSSLWQKGLFRQLPITAASGAGPAPHSSPFASATSAGSSLAAQRSDGSGSSGAAGLSRVLAGSSSFGRSLSNIEALSEASEDEQTTNLEAQLEEVRTSVLAGFKRHFRFKAAEGLLSATSLRVLNYACDDALLQPGHPISLWSKINGDMRHRGLAVYAASLHLQLRRWQTALLRRDRGGSSGVFSRWLLTTPLNNISTFLRKCLGQTGCGVQEVALELWLALTVSPHADMMKRSTSAAASLMQEELADQAAAVWQFILQRQVEAPDEFAALQTHRVQLAVARRQLAFVERLAETGIVEEGAAEALLEMVEKRLHRLEADGPSWHSPSVSDTLRQQPCLSTAPEALLLWLRAYGQLKSFAPGQCIVPRQRSGPPGIFIVLSGLVRVEVIRNGHQECRYVGFGGSIAFVGSLLGRDIPGLSLVGAYAQGDALGRGPLLLHFPMGLLHTIRAKAASASDAASDSRLEAGPKEPAITVAGAGGGAADPAGDAAVLPGVVFAQLLLDMHRQAGLMLLDRTWAAVIDGLNLHLEQAAKAIGDYAPKLLSQPERDSSLEPLMTSLLGTSAAGLGTAGAAEVAAAVADSADAAADSAVGGPPLDEVAVMLRRRATAVAAAKLRDLLRGASLITLQPGEHITQDSSMMLLTGTLRLHAGGNSSAAATAEAVVSLQQFQGPTLLAWGPELFGTAQDRYQPGPRSYFAGTSGALLLTTSISASRVAPGTSPPGPARASITGTDGSSSNNNGPSGSGSGSDSGSSSSSSAASGRRGLNRLTSSVALRGGAGRSMEPDHDGV